MTQNISINTKKLIIETSSNRTKRKHKACYILHAHGGSRSVWLTRPQTNTPRLCQTLHLMLLLTTQALHKHHKHSRASLNTTLEGSSVHSSTLHRLSGEWWLSSGQHRGFSKHWTCREQHCSIFWRVTWSGLGSAHSANRKRLLFFHLELGEG